MCQQIPHPISRTEKAVCCFGFIAFKNRSCIFYCRRWAIFNAFMSERNHFYGSFKWHKGADGKVSRRVYEEGETPRKSNLELKEDCRIKTNNSSWQIFLVQSIQAGFAVWQECYYITIEVELEVVTDILEHSNWRKRKAIIYGRRRK